VITDLFLDLWITPYNDYHVLDEDELENAIRSGFISTNAADKARSQLQSLIKKIGESDFPPIQVREVELLQPPEYDRIFSLPSN